MKSVQVERSRKVIISKPRKKLSTVSNQGFSPIAAPTAPCSCRDCKNKLNRAKVTGIPIPAAPVNINISNNQGRGDFRSRDRVRNPNSTLVGNSTNKTRSRSRQTFKTEFYPSNLNKSKLEEPNIIKKSNSSTTVLFPPRKIVYTSVPVPQVESLVEIYKAPPCTRVQSETEAVPVLRTNCHQVDPSDPHQKNFEQVSSTSCCCNCNCRNNNQNNQQQYLDLENKSSVNSLKSCETFVIPEKTSDESCHLIHQAHTRRVNATITNTNKRPPLPPPNPNRSTTSTCRGQGQGHPVSQSRSPTPNNRQATAILSVGANTVLSAHLNNYRPGLSFSSPSFIVETLGDDDENTKPSCTLARTLPFSREHEIRRAGTSHSTLHGTASYTNLHAEYLEQPEPESCSKCPLCLESKSKSSVHHRTMQSRYMTDLEWRICHAVNIYVYRNGIENQTPILVHIPPARKKNMKHVMSVIQERMKYPIGYAKTLYKMDGTKIRHPCELEMYNNYVVGSNYDKHFKCVQYGRKRSPLLILARESKHVRVLRQHNEHYDNWLIKKKAAGDERPQYVYPVLYTKDGYGPADLPVGQGGNYQPCGPFCKMGNKNCAPFNHENCGPGPGSEGRNKAPDRYQQNEPQYVVNTMTIPTSNLRDTLNLIQQKNKLRIDYENEVESPNPKSKKLSNKKYQSIGKEDESLFYGTKPRKHSKGVVDTSGDKKLFANGRQLELDYNANLLRNEYDEIPDLSPEPTAKFQVEQEMQAEVIDETSEDSQPNHDQGCQDSPPPEPVQHTQFQTRRTKKKPKEKNPGNVTNNNNNKTISATSRSYTIMARLSPPLQQGGTQTSKSNAKVEKGRLVPPNSSASTAVGTNFNDEFPCTANDSGAGVQSSQPLDYFIPNSPTSKQDEENETGHGQDEPPPPDEFEQQFLPVEPVSSGSQVSQGFHLNLNPSDSIGQNVQQQMFWNSHNHDNVHHHNQQQQQSPCQQQQKPSYQVNQSNQYQETPFRPFLIDGSARFAPRGPYFIPQEPGPQENLAIRYDEFSDIMGGTNEVDIPYTPLLQGRSRNTYQPPPGFYPPYQDYRFLPPNCTFDNGFPKPGGALSCTTTTRTTIIDKPKYRNVATQFGVPSFDELPTTYKNSNQGQQQMLQDSYQNQQLRMQQAILQQQQLSAAGTGHGTNSAHILYQPPVYHSTSPSQAPSGQRQSQPFQYMQQSIPPPSQVIQQQVLNHIQNQNPHWNNSNVYSDTGQQQQMQPAQVKSQNVSLCVPPPTRFQDMSTVKINPKNSKNERGTTNNPSPVHRLPPGMRNQNPISNQGRKVTQQTQPQPGFRLGPKTISTTTTFRKVT